MSKPKTIFHKLKMAVPVGHGFKVIRYADILWMQSDKHYTRLVLRNSKSSLYLYESLDELERILPLVFHKCHRSVIVNLCHIESCDEYGININNHSLQVARKHKTEIKHLLKKYESLTFPLCENCDNCPQFSACQIIRPFTFRKISL